MLAITAVSRTMFGDAGWHDGAGWLNQWLHDAGCMTLAGDNPLAGKNLPCHCRKPNDGSAMKDGWL